MGFVQKHHIDVVLLQELKCVDQDFPYKMFEDLGYKILVSGQKAFNGVAILSKFEILENHTDTFHGNSISEQKRYLECEINVDGKHITFISVYVPNGQEVDSPKFREKLEFFDNLLKHLRRLLSANKAVVIAGDFNVAPEDIDAFNPLACEDSVLFHLTVRKKLRAILNAGFYSSYRLINPKAHEFSWWDYRQGAWHKNIGMLIDHILLSPDLADKCVDSTIEKSLRALEQPSDHVPVICTLKL